MTKNKHLLVASTASVFIGACISYYFLIHYQENTLQTIPLLKVIGLLFVFVLGVFSSVAGYRSAIGKYTFHGTNNIHPASSNKIRNIINNPNNIAKAMVIIGYTAPFLIGIGIVSDALRGF